MSRTTVGYLGAALLLVGVFTPIISLPFVGTQNYFGNGEGDGVIILVLVLLSVLLISARWFRGLIVTGILSLLLLLSALLGFRRMMADMRSSMHTTLADNPFAGIGEVMVEGVQLQWGWGVLLLGSVVLIGAGLMRAEGVTAENSEADARNERDCPWCAERILRRAVICRHCGRDVEQKSDKEPVLRDVTAEYHRLEEDEEWKRRERETKEWLSGE